MIAYDTTPDAYRHWALTIDPPVATLTLAPDAEVEVGPDDPDWLLAALLRVDIELADAVQRLRFEHPDVAVVVVTGATGRAFSTGIPGIPPESPSDVAASVWLFRNEVRCAIEDAGAESNQFWVTALNGSACGPGYELALATEEIVLVDDGESAVGFSEITGRGQLPGSSGLTRLVDKRHVRRDLVDALCSRPEGISGREAVDWGLVDLAVPEGRFSEVVGDRARAAGARLPGRPAWEAVVLAPLRREDFDGGFAYPNVRVELDGDSGAAAVTVAGPASHECFAPEPGPKRLRSRWWPLAVCRELDDALLRLRSHRPEVRSLVLRTEGDPLAVASADVALTSGYERDWFVREVVLSWRRTLRRLDLTWQSVIAVIEPGSCFVGTLFELALAADGAYMVDGAAPGATEAPPARIFLTGMNFGPLPEAGGRSRLEARFHGRAGHIPVLAERVGDPLSAAEAAELGLVTGSVAAAEWEPTIRRAIEERAGARFGDRAGLAFALPGAGPQTLEGKIFAGCARWTSRRR